MCIIAACQAGRECLRRLTEQLVDGQTSLQTQKLESLVQTKLCITRLPDSTQKLSRKEGRVIRPRCARQNCLTLGVHSTSWGIEKGRVGAEMNSVSVLQSEKKLVDVTGIEPGAICSDNYLIRLMSPMRCTGN